MPKTVIALPKYEYEEEPIKITGEVYQNFEDARVAEGLKNRYVRGDCQCVGYAKALTGFTQSIGRASNWPRNSTEPVVGGVVVTNESASGHVGIILRVWEDTIVITEKNYIPCKVGTRELRKDDPRIKGYWR